MAQVPANWNNVGGGPSGHGPALPGGAGNQFNGQDLNIFAAAINAVPAKGVATVVATTPQAGTYSQPGGSGVGVGATFTYGAAGVLTLDSHALGALEYVLLAAQAAPAQNGLYQVSTAGAPGVAAILTRVAALNSPADFPGALVMVAGGAMYAGTLWLCTASGAPVMGTDPLPWVQPQPRKRVLPVANPGTLTPNTDTFDVLEATALAGTLVVGAPSGNPAPYAPMTWVFVDGGAGTALVWDAAHYTTFGVVGGLPAMVPPGKEMTMQWLYNARRGKWALAAVDTVGYNA